MSVLGIGAPAATRPARPSRGGTPAVRPTVLVVLGGLLACTFAMGYVWIRLRVVDLGYQLGKESRLSQQLDDENRRLRVAVESLKAPGRIERVAREKLGMVPPTVGEIRSVSALRPGAKADRED